MLGSAIGVNVIWALLLVLVGPYFIHSARREETVMLQLFPEQYAYRAQTGMLAPCPFRRRLSGRPRRYCRNHPPPRKRLRAQ
jgi:protein-S-isoprenylcysteine O-methyltransferase Ste14